MRRLAEGAHVFSPGRAAFRKAAADRPADHGGADISLKNQKTIFGCF